MLPVYIRYKSDDLLEQLNFDFIAEQHKSVESKYVLGGIKISELIAKKEIISNDGAFIAQAAALKGTFEDVNKQNLKIAQTIF